MVYTGHISDLARRTDVVRAAARRGIASGSARVRAASARIAEVTRLLAGYEAPRMPPELVHRIDQALAAEVARRGLPQTAPPPLAPVPVPEQDVQIPDGAIPSPRGPVLGG